MTHTVPWDASQVLPWRAGLAYGLLGLPLAFAALPLYVVLPHYYASNLGLPLASVGALLLLVRLMDAGAEPLLGRMSDRLYSRTVHTVLWVVGASALLLGGGMAGLFFPPVQGPGALAAWMVAGLLFTCLAHSLLAVGPLGRGHGQRAVGGLGRGHHAGRVRTGIAGRLAGAVAGAASAVFSRAAGGA